VTIKANSGLSDGEVEKMVRDAELNAEQDKQRVELVSARNQAQSFVHTTRKSLEEHGDKLEAGEKEAIEAALKDLEAVLDGDDKAAIDAKTEALAKASQKLGEKVYADMAAAQGGNAQPGGHTDEGAAAGAQQADDIVDADFKEVNDKK
jgi:molecular chaperone DnaK